ncbi:hypothetical protein FA15DRAFT_300858 [Coprinopsis marcescibilis]|uniref:Uncharacterized protein n=1 Tax=Coprinopsis marcescibilis TaxID=230819 RepID=A0A5C3KCZ6_COPMA|nr:hypothetical protein FA15DRAFT_300858 [Coprinopsis marcescibilis]
MSTDSRSGWWWSYFKPHPWRNHSDPSKKAEAFCGTSTATKPKAYCIACFNHHVLEVAAEDRLAVQSGRIARERTEEEIETYCKYISLNRCNKI